MLAILGRIEIEAVDHDDGGNLGRDRHVKARPFFLSAVIVNIENPAFVVEGHPKHDMRFLRLFIFLSGRPTRYTRRYIIAQRRRFGNWDMPGRCPRLCGALPGVTFEKTGWDYKTGQKRGDMANQKIAFASGLYDRFLPLYTKQVVPDGIDLDFTVIDSPREIFDRMAGGLEFDACEMSGTEYITHLATGNSPFVALPVFASRMFRHGFITINTKSGIKTPKDLEGRRLGVQLYTMSAAMWIRGMLQHDHGVDLSGVT